MMYHLLLDETSKCRPRKTQMTAFDGRSTVAVAANASASGRDESALAASASASSHGHHRRAHAVSAVSVELESVRDAVKKWKNEVRVVKSCAHRNDEDLSSLCLG